MSEAAEQTTEAEVDPVVEKDSKVSATEETARAGGWKPESEWEGEDKNKPAQFISAELFNERGVWIERHKVQQKQIDEMKTTFNTRMDNANKLHNQQLEVQKSELIRKRDDAIDDADRETANKIQGDIDKINEQSVEAATAPASNEQSTLDTWNTANPWILGNDPKAAYAKQQFQAYQSQGMDPNAALSQMESDVNRAFPAINTERDRQPAIEGGTKPGGKRTPRKLAMSDLTSEERKYYRAMPGAWKTEKDYLQAVQDTRGES